MANSPKDNLLPFQASEQAQGPWLADVIELVDRQVHLDLHQADILVPFTQCAAAVHGLRPGDRVLVRRLGEAFIIEARMMREGEAPLPIEYNHLGELVIEAKQAMRLRTPKGEILLDRRGKLRLHADCIDSDAENENRISGTMIKLN